MNKLGPLYFRELGRDAPLRSLALHPGAWLIIVWAAVLTVWAVLPDETFFRVTGTNRYSTANSITFMVLMLATFFAGSLIGPVLLRLRTPARRTVADDPARTVQVLGVATLVACSINLLAIGFILLQGFAKAGGPGTVISEFLSGVSSQQLANSYFISSRIQGLTAWIHISTATAALGTLAFLMAERGSTWHRVLLPVLVVGVLSALTHAFVLNDRLAVYEYLVVAAAVWIGYRVFHGKPVLTAGVATRVGLVVLLGAGVWFGAEFGRTYLARYGPNNDDSSEALTPSQVAGDSLLAYLVTGPNNALYAVDHTEVHSYFYRTFHGAFTTLSLDNRETPIFGEVRGEPSRLLGEIYRGSLAFTVYSFVGNAYFDLGWAGLLIGLWFGMVIGGVYHKFAAGELWALLLYPLLFVGVLDSWRTMYWGESRALIPLFAIVAVSLIVYTRSHAPSYHAAQQPSLTEGSGP